MKKKKFIVRTAAHTTTRLVKNRPICENTTPLWPLYTPTHTYTHTPEATPSKNIPVAKSRSVLSHRLIRVLCRYRTTHLLFSNYLRRDKIKIRLLKIINNIQSKIFIANPPKTLNLKIYHSKIIINLKPFIIIHDLCRD